LSIPQQYVGNESFWWCIQEKEFEVIYFILIYIASRDKSAFILTTHGGHLGFYDGGLIKPNTVTWLVRHNKQFPVISFHPLTFAFSFLVTRLDRTAVGIADAILRDSHTKSL